MSNSRKRPRGRALVALSALGAASLATGVLPSSSYADPKAPSLKDVQRQVNQLMEEAEQVVEAGNEAGDNAIAIERRLRMLKVDVTRQERKVKELRASIGAYAASVYRSGSMDSTIQLLTSDDPDELIAQIGSAKALEDQQANTLLALEAEQKELTDFKAEQAAALENLRKTKRELVDRTRTANEKLARAKALLAKLTKEQRALLEAQERQRDGRTSRGDDRDNPGPLPAPSGRGKIAVEYAEKQIGDPYVFAADGPSSFDCSGLTMAAWREANVSLPHSARRQYRSGVHVSRSQAKPGDLVLFYNDLHHVGLYVGNGMMIHAPRRGTNVRYDSVYGSHMPVIGFVRPG